MSKVCPNCSLCGRNPAAGYALIGDARYCHGDDDWEPTCYMQSQYRLFGSVIYAEHSETLRRLSFDD